MTPHVIWPVVAACFFVVTGTALYFLPSVVAYKRKHNNMTSIVVVNLFFGWTILGWALALVWAVANPPARQ